jgi:hypothetical protein
MDTDPLQFIDEPIEVHFDVPPTFEKSPTCPNAFTWQGKTLYIEKMLAEWQDYRRRGRVERNMQPAHAQQALRAGSWGVGRYYFRIQVDDGRIFEIYYDRAPGDVNHRKGSWFIFGQRTQPPAQG